MKSIKPMIESSILSSIFIVLTILSTSIGLGFLGYYDYFVPTFFAIIFLRCGNKYASMGAVLSILIIFFILGNPMSPLLVAQGAILGLFTGFVLTKLDNIGDELVFTVIIALVGLLVFDLLIRMFTNISIISNMDEFSKSMREAVDQSMNLVGSMYSAEQLELVKANFEYFLQEKKLEQIMYMSLALLSFGSGFIVYFLSIIISKKLKIGIRGKEYKQVIVGRMKLFGRMIYSTSKMYYFMLIYVALAELLKSSNIEIGIDYLRAVIYGIEYIFMLFSFKDSMVIIENLRLIKYGKKKARVGWFRFMVFLVFMMVNPKVGYFGVCLMCVFMDKNNEYRNTVNKNFIERLKAAN